MLQLLNPWMLCGLLAVAAPILVHLLHRYRVHATPFAGMRFLNQVMVRLQRKLRWQGILLLCIRCLTLVILILALSQPLWRSQLDYSQILERQGATGAVIVFDNSASSTKDLSALKELAHHYINTLRSGDAVSILSLNNEHRQTMYDFQSAHALIDRISETDAQSDLSLIFRNVQSSLQSHVNPFKEVIIITDGQKNSWNEASIQQLKNIQSELKLDDNEARFIVLAPPHDPSANNSAIRSLHSSQQVVAVGQRCLFSIAIHHEGTIPQNQCILRIRADGRIIDERVINRENDVEEIVHCEYKFSEPGSHHVSAELVGLRDSIPNDNIRYISIAVIKRIPILLIDSFDGKQLRPIELALKASNDEQGAFDVNHADITDISAELLALYPVVILANTAALDGQSIATIERYVVGGGNIIAMLGQHSRAPVINSLWSRNGDGFLPCNVEDAREAEQSFNTFIQFEQDQHPAFATLPGARQQLFSSCTVYKYMPLDTSSMIADEDFNVLMTLNTGEAFLVERHRGQGRVLLMASNFDFDWTDIASHGIFVPWIRGLCSYLSSFLLPPRNILCGEQIIHLLHDNKSYDFVSMEGSSLNQERGSWQGHQVNRSDIVWRAGLYAARQQDQETWYAVNVPSNEQSIEHLNPSDISSFDAQLLLMRTAADIQQSWGSGEDSALPLWRIGLLCCICLLLIETWYARSLATTESAS